MSKIRVTVSYGFECDFADQQKISPEWAVPSDLLIEAAEQFSKEPFLLLDAASLGIENPTIISDQLKYEISEDGEIWTEVNPARLNGEDEDEDEDDIRTVLSK